MFSGPLLPVPRATVQTSSVQTDLDADSLKDLEDSKRWVSPAGLGSLSLSLSFLLTLFLYISLCVSSFHVSVICPSRIFLCAHVIA